MLSVIQSKYPCISNNEVNVVSRMLLPRTRASRCAALRPIRPGFPAALPSHQTTFPARPRPQSCTRGHTEVRTHNIDIAPSSQRPADLVCIDWGSPLSSINFCNLQTISIMVSLLSIDINQI